MDDKTSSELLQALNSIQAELHRMNQTLATMATQQSRPSSSGTPMTGRPSATGRPAGRPKEGGYSRPERSGAPSFGGSDSTPRFGKGKPSGAGRPKGKPPSKKGDGYPKKAR